MVFKPRAASRSRHLKQRLRPFLAYRPGLDLAKSPGRPGRRHPGPVTDRKPTAPFRPVCGIMGLGWTLAKTGRLRLRLDRKEDTMVSPILVPLDGSRLAEQALPCAVMLGKGLSAELVLLRAVSMETDADEALKEIGLEIDRLMDQAEAEAEGYLEKVAAQIREPGLDASQVVCRGPAAEAIVDHASQTGIQQIVMATHGYSGISRWRYGSVAERVLLSANVPVLLIRAKEGEQSDRQETKRCQRVLVPLDGSEMAEQVLPAAAEVARAVGAEIVLLRVVTLQVYGSSEAMWYPGPDGWVEAITQAAVTYLNQVADSLRERGVGVTIATETGPVAETIIRFAEANLIDLVAMCTHGRTGLVRWALGSVADRVLRGGSTPVLLVRARPSHATADSSRI